MKIGKTNLRKGFTLIEMLIVIVIIGILAAAILPWLLKQKSDTEAMTLVSDTNSIAKGYLGFVSADIPTERGIKHGSDELYKSSGEVVFRKDADSTIDTTMNEAEEVFSGVKLQNFLADDYGATLKDGKFSYIVTADKATALTSLVATPAKLATGNTIVLSYDVAGGTPKSFLVYCGKKGLQDHGTLKDKSAKGETKAVYDALLAETTHLGSCFPVDLSI